MIAAANEWADILAGEAMANKQANKGRRLQVPRRPARFCSQRPSRVDTCGQVAVCVGEWVGQRDSHAQRLMEFVTQTVIFDEEQHLVVGKLGCGLGAAVRGQFVCSG